VEWKWVWANQGSEDLEATVPSTDNDISKTAGECGTFQLAGWVA
jgi:hypothetical protein